MKEFSSNNEIKTLFDTVIKGGYCVGCGACASLEGSPMKIEFNKYGQYEATANSEVVSIGNNSILKVCPFSDLSVNEDVLGHELYGGDNSANKDEKLGYFLSTYAGFVGEDAFRDNGSSGGIGTWILAEMFKNNLVDGVIHVHSKVATEEDPAIFEYKISKSIRDVYKGAKSRYYPIEISKVMQMVRNTPGKFVIVGLPCFIKSVRLLQKQDPILKERIKYCVALVCGHLKSTHFASMWAWQNGIHPNGLKSINFRTKLEGYGANQYGATISGTVNGKEETRVSRPLNQLYGGNWGWGLFKYKACDYCDDVVGETADITIGDAWLPQYLKDSKGTNVLVIRNTVVDKLVKDAVIDKRLFLDEISATEVVKSQEGGFAHRREGLAYRLSLAVEEKVWYPKKRVKPADRSIGSRIKKKHNLRILLAEKSHVAFQNALKLDSFKAFQLELEPLVKAYGRLYSPPLWKRIVQKIKKEMRF